jgi:PncC family amidohydrolase
MADQPLEAYVGVLLRQRGMTLATAESCTGGLLGHRLTNVPGSSEYYLGGVVAYADAVKVALLGVDADLLAREGAVSGDVARQMASGVRERLRADIGIGITGIAGPAGGTADKPVGLVYIALAAEGVVRCERHVWPYDREGNKLASAQRALEMVLLHLEGQEPATENWQLRTEN